MLHACLGFATPYVHANVQFNIKLSVFLPFHCGHGSDIVQGGVNCLNPLVSFPWDQGKMSMYGTPIPYKPYR